MKRRTPILDKRRNGHGFVVNYVYDELDRIERI